MTLSRGDLLAKVVKAPDGSLQLVQGEAQHLFLVKKVGNTWEYNESDKTTIYGALADLQVVE